MRLEGHSLRAIAAAMAERGLQISHVGVKAVIEAHIGGLATKLKD